MEIARCFSLFERRNVIRLSMERYADYNQTAAVVARVMPGSIAEELGIVAGDVLLAIDGEAVPDVFDFRLRQQAESLLLLIRSIHGELIEYDIEKDEEDLLGLEFENPLMCHCESCENHCLFCFIDQLPSGLRESLYFKDDDSRLSFLTGNYVSLSNIDDREFERILSLHLSPLNLSVHSCDAKIRSKLLGNRKAAELMPRIEKLREAGISINAQFVLCPGINDGDLLDESLRELIQTAGEHLLSAALVPVGLSRWRETNKLYPLSSCDKKMAQRTLRSCQFWQQSCLKQYGRRMVYAADEFYLLAGMDLPAVSDYEDFPQLENGVGMTSLFLEQINNILGRRGEADGGFSRYCPLRGERSREGLLTIATGKLAAPFFKELQWRLQEWSGLEIKVIAVDNVLFGSEITVAGLLCGQDLLERLSREKELGTLLLCESMLKRGENIFLDDLSLEELSEGLDCAVAACGEDGHSFMAALREASSPIATAGRYGL